MINTINNDKNLAMAKKNATIARIIPAGASTEFATFDRKSESCNQFDRGGTANGKDQSIPETLVVSVIPVVPTL